MMKVKIISLIKYFQEYKNPISALLFKFGIKKNCIIKVKDKNINDFNFTQKEIYLLNSYTLTKFNLDNHKYDDFCKFINQLTSKSKIIDAQGVKFVNNKAITVVFESFGGDYPWELCPVKNRTVIDIGANIGDSALLFVKKGAKEVHAFEPVPPIFNIAQENLKLNPQLAKNVYLYNKAVSCKNGKKEIYFKDLVTSGMSSEYLKEGNSYEIESIKLDEFMDKNNIEYDILKMDCEGCEYEIILNTDLSKFKDILVEYHGKIANKPHKILLEKLKNENFNTDVYSLDKIEDLGIIHAYK